MGQGTWTLALAKAKFSEVVEKARANGPQTVAKNGRVAVMVVSAQEWEKKLLRVRNLAQFLAESPLPGSGLRVQRRKDGPRKVEL